MLVFYILSPQGFFCSGHLDEKTVLVEVLKLHILILYRMALWALGDFSMPENASEVKSYTDKSYTQKTSHPNDNTSNMQYCN